MQDPLQENLCDGVLFNEIAEIKTMVGIAKKIYAIWYFFYVGPANEFARKFAM